MLYLKMRTMQQHLNGLRMVVDIDDTICKHSADSGDLRFVTATPIQEVIDKVNKLYDEGWYIILCTARGYLSRKGDQLLAAKELGGITTEWLIRHNVKFNELHFGKPYADYYLDDKALTIDSFLEEF